MKKNEKCKLVQDLLPNYIEKLTSEDTNKYIEEHLKGCNECKEVLKNMGENIVLDKIEEKKKIDYLKKIKRRQKIIIGVILVIAVIFIMLVIDIFSSGYPVDKNGKIEFKEAIELWIKSKRGVITSKLTNIILTSKEESGLNPTTIVFTFDENEKCIGARYSVRGYTEEEALERYNSFKEAENSMAPVITNIQIHGGELIYNYSYWNGKTKEEVQDELSSYDDYIIQEI